jgi:pimeloyl-ACP methyl ester carboxylesterase
MGLRRTAGVLGALASGPIVAALAGIAYSALFVPHALKLPPAVGGERRELAGRAGRLSYYVAGPAGAAPLLLVHSVNAAASAYEVGPLFEHYKASRRVYALDLPGFGFSERSAREYTPRLFTDAVLELLDAIADAEGPAPVDVVALSLGGEFAARAAAERPERFGTLALVTPTGFGEGQPRYEAPGSTREAPGLRAFFTFPLWSQALFDLLNSRASQRYFLKQTFGSYEAIDPGLLAYDYLTAHQPGARHAPFAFVSGALFSADIGRVYESLELPVWLAHGTRGQFSDFSAAGSVAARGNWTIQPFETGSIPYFERPADFFAAYERFLKGARWLSA